MFSSHRSQRWSPALRLPHRRYVRKCRNKKKVLQQQRCQFEARRLAHRRYVRKCRKEEVLQQQRCQFEKFDDTSDMLCFFIAALMFSSQPSDLSRTLVGAPGGCLQGSISEENSVVAKDMVKQLQMYHVSVVSAIAQKKWREEHGVSDWSITGDAKQYWAPLIDPKKDFRDRRPTNLREVYTRLRAAAVEAGVGGEPELEPVFWDAQLTPLGSSNVSSNPHTVEVSPVFVGCEVAGNADPIIQDGLPGTAAPHGAWRRHGDVCVRLICCATYFCFLFTLWRRVQAEVVALFAYSVVRASTAITGLAHGPRCRQETTLAVVLLTAAFASPAFCACSALGLQLVLRSFCGGVRRSCERHLWLVSKMLRCGFLSRERKERLPSLVFGSASAAFRLQVALAKPVLARERRGSVPCKTAAWSTALVATRLSRGCRKMTCRLLAHAPPALFRQRALRSLISIILKSKRPEVGAACMH